MKFADIVSFRKDLLFNGAVQLSWFEKDKAQADKAAEHFVFHGPDYHGVAEEDLDSSSHILVDTANFTLDILERVNGKIADEPFALAIAGYGTGKSHLAITLASLFSKPQSDVAAKILANISMADAVIGKRVREIISESLSQPYLVVTINGMQDFDLCSEIIRQVLRILNQNGLSTTILENLRPRFKSAMHFTESFFGPLKEDFIRRFGESCDVQEIVERLKCQDEETFCKVNDIYEQKMGSPIHAVGQESLHDFIRITKETYCGPGKPFAGILIIFDEFGRYLEFAVQKPHVAGSGVLQQLFECVQANGDKVFLLCFIQYELKAYISRVAPELREDLNRYVTRYDAVRKVRLSTNLETLIANLLEKKNPEELERQVKGVDEPPATVQLLMKRWFPDIRNHALWMDIDRFERIIYKGCWPLHPLSTWVLYKLSSIGKSLQQRSALSLLADVYTDYRNAELEPGRTIRPVDLCNEAMINEFLASERYGQQGAAAHAYENVLQKYQYEFIGNERIVLKAVLIATKIGVKAESKEDYLQILAMFSGLEKDVISDAVRLLEYEYGVLEWNELIHQYEITGDAVPRRAFIAQLEAKVAKIDSHTRANIFSQNYKKWMEFEIYNTDFGPQNNITTREWNFKVTFTNVSMLEGQIDYALRIWRDARGVDEEKGQLIYCYVGPESNIEAIKERAHKLMKSGMEKNKLEWERGAPVAVIFLNDEDGAFGHKIAEYWVLQEQMTEEDSQKFANYILDRKNSLVQEMQNLFSELERKRHIVFATDKQIGESRIKNMLTQLFEVVYPKRVTFPFDGFHTARGNAAKDCQVFTKELFLGNLDRDWISARGAQQRNRAYEVLDRSWGVISDDGSIRMKPSNKAVREIIELLESQLEKNEDSETQKFINMGETMRLLCMPPYGCNIASAGLILALFIGRRKNELLLLKDNQAISFENWLQDAVPGNFFDLSVLDVTNVVRVSKESLSEWENLLDEWDVETTLVGKIDFQKKALELKERIPVPQQLYYKYKHLFDQANDALRKLNSCQNIIDEALEKAQKGMEKDNVGLLSWGAADLADLYNMMCRESKQWTQEQIKEVEKHMAYVRLQTQQRFPKWLSRQTVADIEQLSKFKHKMIVNIGGNLAKLGLDEEKKQLEAHVGEVEKYIRFITEVKRTASDIENMVQNNVVSNSTPVQVLDTWLEQVKEFAKRLKEAKARKKIVQGDIDAATKKLAEFQKACQEQLEQHQERMTQVYNIKEISSLSDIAYWRNEVASLLVIYEGLEKDVDDLKLVQKQLDLVEMHYRQLDDENLSETEFEVACKRCIEENYAEFSDDAPPLDNELIYGSLAKAIRAKRQRAADNWMQRNIPDLETISKFNASEALECKSRLEKWPRVLSDQQVKTVHEVLAACERRLDELEVEGLLAKFEALSERGKKEFLQRLATYFNNLVILK